MYCEGKSRESTQEHGIKEQKGQIERDCTTLKKDAVRKWGGERGKMKGVRKGNCTLDHWQGPSLHPMMVFMTHEDNTLLFISSTSLFFKPHLSFYFYFLQIKSNEGVILSSHDHSSPSYMKRCQSIVSIISLSPLFLTLAPCLFHAAKLHFDIVSYVNGVLCWL